MVGETPPPERFVPMNLYQVLDWSVTELSKSEWDLNLPLSKMALDHKIVYVGDLVQLPRERVEEVLGAEHAKKVKAILKVLQLDYGMKATRWKRPTI